jgi:Zn-dependent metalloprotease
MIRKILVLIIGTLMIGQVNAQTDKANIRPAFELKLNVNDSIFYNASMSESKYIINDSIIQIFPGEKLFVEAENVNNKLTNFKVVNEIKDKSKTLVFDFKQTTKGKVHGEMILTIENPFDKQLQYRAMMNLMRNQKWVNTSVFPVRPRLKCMEIWADLITSLALVGFELKDI